MNTYSWNGKTILRNIVLTLIFLIFMEFLARFGVFLVVAINLFLISYYLLDLFAWGGVIQHISIDEENGRVLLKGRRWFGAWNQDFPLAEVKAEFGNGPGPFGLKLTALRLAHKGWRTRITPDYHGWMAEDLAEVAAKIQAIHAGVVS
jgi:hypothetical protein